jgi:hypothetical protein
VSDEKVYRIPQIGWVKCLGGLRADTVFGRIYLAERADGWSFYRPGDESANAARMTEAEAKRFAQAWYVERIANGLEEVPTTLTDEQHERLTKALREDAT